MMIWFVTSHGSPPQHIGNTDGIGSTEELIQGARKARHFTAKFCVKATKGNDVKYYMFDDSENMIDFQMRNTDMQYSELAAA